MTVAMSKAAVAQVLGEGIVTARTLALMRDIQQYFPARNNASFLPECTRQMEYARLAPGSRQMWDAEFQARLNDGKEDERRLSRDLIDLGFDVVEGQSRFELKEIQLSGKIEGKIEFEYDAGEKCRVPFECKSINVFDYQKLNALEDFQHKHWHRKILRQCQAYLWGFNEEAMLLFVTDGHGHWKFFVVTIDASVGEDIFSRCETVNKTVERNAGIREVEDMTFSPRIEYSSEVCGSCPFRATCLPDVASGQGAVIADEELATKIARYHELGASASERETLGKEIRDAVTGKEMIVAGNFVVSGKWVDVKGNPNPKPRPATRYWKWSADPLSGAPSGTSNG